VVNKDPTRPPPPIILTFIVESLFTTKTRRIQIQYQPQMTQMDADKRQMHFHLRPSALSAVNTSSHFLCLSLCSLWLIVFVFVFTKPRP